MLTRQYAGGGGPSEGQYPAVERWVPDRGVIPLGHRIKPPPLASSSSGRDPYRFLGHAPARAAHGDCDVGQEKCFSFSVGSVMQLSSRSVLGSTTPIVPPAHPSRGIERRALRGRSEAFRRPRGSLSFQYGRRRGRSSLRPPTGLKDRAKLAVATGGHNHDE